MQQLLRKHLAANVDVAQSRLVSTAVLFDRQWGEGVIAECDLILEADDPLTYCRKRDEELFSQRTECAFAWGKSDAVRNVLREFYGEAATGDKAPPKRKKAPTKKEELATQTIFDLLAGV